MKQSDFVAFKFNTFGLFSIARNNSDEKQSKNVKKFYS